MKKSGDTGAMADWRTTASTTSTGNTTTPNSVNAKETDKSIDLAAPESADQCVSETQDRSVSQDSGVGGLQWPPRSPSSTGEQDTKTTENATDGQKATAKSNVGGGADRGGGRHGSSNATAGSRYPHHPRPRETEEVLMRRRVFVGNMSRQCTREQLMTFLTEQFGPLYDANIIRDRENDTSKGYGFVTFQSEEQAQACLAMKQISFMGRQLNFGPAKRKDKRFGQDFPGGPPFQPYLGQQMAPQRYMSGVPDGSMYYPQPYFYITGGGGMDDQRRPQLYYQPQFQQWQHPQMQPQQPQLHAAQQQLPDSSPVLASGMPNPESQFYPQQFLMYNPAMQPAMAAMPQQMYVAPPQMVPAASMGDYVVQPTTTQQDAKLDGEVAQVTQQFDELGT